jgi:subtilisin-like proprotein convertase family protein
MPIELTTDPPDGIHQQRLDVHLTHPRRPLEPPAVGDLPVLAKLDAACGTGLVIKGLKADGSYDCAVAMDPAGFPGDALNEISNGLLTNEFTDVAQGGKAVKIPDNNPVGVSDTIDFPDVGIAKKLTVNIDITNSKIQTLNVFLYDPDNKEYQLHKASGTGTTIKTSFPTPTKTVSGDLTTWVTKNPKGKWFLKVIDTDYVNNTTDGQINTWSIAIETMSSKKVQVKGDLIIDGSLVMSGGGFKVPADASTCDATKFGTLRWSATLGLQVCNKNQHANGTIAYFWTVAQPQPVLWSGGCSGSSGAGWITYCLNQTEFNTAGDYFDVNANGTITFKVSGYYRIRAWAICVASDYCRQQYFKNGSGITYTLEYDGHNSWQTLENHQIWPFKIGDTFFVQYYSNNSTSAHAWNAAGQHSRFQIEFAGPLTNP